MSIEIPSDQLWMVIVGFLIALVLAFGIGANDVANSFGTSVGAKVLTLKWACILASVFETLGSILLGAKVSDTIRKGIIDVEPYMNNTGLLMMGNVAALSGSCVWMMAATVLRLPVSATHSIVGATVGFSLVAHGVRGINWGKLGMIIGSWFVSPLLAGIVSTSIFYFCKFAILNKRDPLEPGLRFLPVFYAATVVINLFSVCYDGPPMLGLDKIPLWGTAILSVASGLICAIIVRLAVVPWQRKRITELCKYKPPPSPPPDGVQEDEDVKVTYSANSSSSSSRTNSRRNSLDSEKAMLKSIIAMEMQQNEKNAAQMITPPTEGDTNTVVNPTSPVKAANARITSPPPKISKTEDALLVDNEYKLGDSTPNKGSTQDMKDVESGEQKGFITNTNDDTVAKLALSSLEQGRSSIKERPETARLFSFLQILTAVFGSFAHGGNDVSNAIGPLVSLWLIGTSGSVTAKSHTPVWILFYGGLGISLGLWIWGRRVIKTIGEDLTKITPSSGFCIEIGSALTVLVASNIGIPISTTHCKVGSIVCVGRVRSRENVDWSVFRNIVLAWLVTLPVSAAISAALMAAILELAL